jgi:hypothetical protein
MATIVSQSVGKGMNVVGPCDRGALELSPVHFGGGGRVCCRNRRCKQRPPHNATLGCVSCAFLENAYRRMHASPWEMLIVVRHTAPFLGEP